MRTATPGPQDAGLWRDLGALRRHFWLPLASLAIAVAAALSLGALRPGEGDARFRMNVVVDALPPLFGPAVLPSPFDYARLATSDAVVADVSTRTGVPVEDLRLRLRAEPRLNTAEIDFRVTGGGARTVARAWHDAFSEAAVAQTPAIERLLVMPYARQLEEARAQLAAASAAASARPDDVAAKQELAAAEENYTTASRLSQSYEVVSKTMTASPMTVVAPHSSGPGLGSRAGRLGAAVAIGLLVGVLGALALDYASSRRPRRPVPEPIDARPALRQRSG